MNAGIKPSLEKDCDELSLAKCIHFADVTYSKPVTPFDLARG
jgi:hypothetical protein